LEREKSEKLGKILRSIESKSLRRKINFLASPSLNFARIRLSLVLLNHIKDELRMCAAFFDAIQLHTSSFCVIKLILQPFKKRKTEETSNLFVEIFSLPRLKV
jgi:hypothetical protein